MEDEGVRVEDEEGGMEEGVRRTEEGVEVRRKINTWAQVDN